MHISLTLHHYVSFLVINDIKIYWDSRKRCLNKTFICMKSMQLNLLLYTSICCCVSFSFPSTSSGNWSLSLSTDVGITEIQRDKL